MMDTPRYELCIPCRVEGLLGACVIQPVRRYKRDIKKEYLKISVTDCISFYSIVDIYEDCFTISE